MCMKRHACVSKAYQAHAQWNRHTHTHTHWFTHKIQNKEGLKRHTEKDAHTSPDAHTQRAVGILWLNLFMLEFLEKIVLKAAHHFCMRGDDWNWSASLFISVFSLFRFFSFVILSLSHGPAHNIKCSLCLSCSLLFLHLSGPLDKWVIKSLRRCKVYERNGEDIHTHTHGRVLSYTETVRRNKSKSFAGIEANYHGNRQYTDQFSDVSATALKCLGQEEVTEAAKGATMTCGIVGPLNQHWI